MNIGFRTYILGVVFMLGHGNPLMARSIFLNGVDVSNVRNQSLKGVDLRIDERGDLYIAAPHYQAVEGDRYTPLSRLGPSTNSGTDRQPPHQEGMGSLHSPHPGQLPQMPMSSTPGLGIPPSKDNPASKAAEEPPVLKEKRQDPPPVEGAALPGNIPSK